MTRITLVASLAAAMVLGTTSLGWLSIANAEPMQRSARGATTATTSLISLTETRIARGAPGAVDFDGTALRMWTARGSLQQRD